MREFRVVLAVVFVLAMAGQAAGQIHPNDLGPPTNWCYGNYEQPWSDHTIWTLWHVPTVDEVAVVGMSSARPLIDDGIDAVGDYLYLGRVVTMGYAKIVQQGGTATFNNALHGSMGRGMYSMYGGTLTVHEHYDCTVGVLLGEGRDYFSPNGYWDANGTPDVSDEITFGQFTFRSLDETTSIPWLEPQIDGPGAYGVTKINVVGYEGEDGHVTGEATFSREYSMLKIRDNTGGVYTPSIADWVDIVTAEDIVDNIRPATDSSEWDTSSGCEWLLRIVDTGDGNETLRAVWAYLYDGDVSRDGFVDGNDLDILLSDWGKNVPPADPRADPSGNSYVDGGDLDIILSDWGKGIPLVGPGSVPEPLTLSFLTVGALALIRRRR